MLFIYISAFLFLLASGENVCDKKDVITKCTCGFKLYRNKYKYVVDCSRRDQTHILDNAQLPKRIDELDLSHNYIQELSFQEADFESVTLTVLQMSYNNISVISAEFMRSVPNLKRLDLSHNAIKNLDNNVFVNVPNLKLLDISYNALTNLPDRLFAPVSNLKYLDISYNDLGIQLMSFKSFFDSPLGLSSNLTHLRLNYVNMSDVSSVYFTNSNLISICLADNYFYKIPKLPNTIQQLDASGNYMESLNLQQLNYPHMKNLILNRLNVLSYVEPFVFYNMQELEYLSIENCPKLTELNHDAFGNLVPGEKFSLKKLSLFANGLRRLNDSYFNLFNALEEVNIGHNPWDCNCDVVWFKLLPLKFKNPSAVRCASPQKLRSKEVLKLTDKQLPKCVVGSGWSTHKILVAIITFLILLLVFIVIFLIYLGPYSTTYMSNKYISTMSPYNSRPSFNEEPTLNFDSIN